MQFHFLGIFFTVYQMEASMYKQVLILNGLNIVADGLLDGSGTANACTLMVGKAL